MLAAAIPVWERLRQRWCASNKSLKNPAEALIPPNLAAVGDKLKDEALAEAVNGGMKKRRLPWLAVHMPRFQHSEAERSALLATFISHDRVPDDAPDSAVARTDAAQAHLAAGIRRGESPGRRAKTRRSARV